jgi:hypothetical protein
MTKSKNRTIEAVASSRFKDSAASAGLESYNGKQALRSDGATISLKEGWDHTESVDLDRHFLESEPNAARWDYGVGIRDGENELIFWVEPHPASSTGEVNRMIAKKNWLKNKLDSDRFESLRAMTNDTTAKQYAAFCWVHSGELRITAQSKEAKMLALAGIRMPCRHLELPAS